VVKDLRHAGGFTLLELLVVIGVMAVVATLIGVGLGRSNEGAALATGQALLQSQLNAVRAQAALRGQAAALVVAVDATEPERRRRALAVAVLDQSLWRAVDAPVLLPAGVGMLGPGEGSDLWESALLPVALDPGDATTSCWVLRLAPSGGVVGGGTGELWLALGQVGAGGWSAEANAARRGVRLSRYGAVELVDEGEIAP
jgi:prepilin-type N-terminal cleavage/methylation domain-containing protein